MPYTNLVGPILKSGETAEAIILAIQQLNHNVHVEDKNAYFRISVLNRCILTQEVIESVLGRPFSIPNDLEKVILSSQGKLTIKRNEVIWEISKEDSAIERP